MNSLPLFSVITICYNAGDLIRKTIESVLAQDFGAGLDACASSSSISCQNNSGCRFEYIIQDGASKDNTLEMVNEYKSRFEEKNIKLVINSEKDGGIYDAMNRGVAAASGKYIIFMNADDCFYSETVLNDVCSSLKSYMNQNTSHYSDNQDRSNIIDSCSDKIRSDQISIDSELPDIIYGDCIVKELGMYFKFRKHYELIKERMPFSHQACFAKRELITKYPLDLSYPITADYDFLLKCHMNNCSFYDSNVIISLVTADGVSSVNMYDAFSEACKVCESHGVPRYTEKEMKDKIMEMKIKQFVLSCFPGFIIKSIRKYQVTHRGQTLKVTVPEWAK